MRERVYVAVVGNQDSGKDYLVHQIVKQYHNKDFTFNWKGEQEDENHATFQSKLDQLIHQKKQSIVTKTVNDSRIKYKLSVDQVELTLANTLSYEKSTLVYENLTQESAFCNCVLLVLSTTQIKQNLPLDFYEQVELSYALGVREFMLVVTDVDQYDREKYQNVFEFINTVKEQVNLMKPKSIPYVKFHKPIPICIDLKGRIKTIKTRVNEVTTVIENLLILTLKNLQKPNNLNDNELKLMVHNFSLKNPLGYLISCKNFYGSFNDQSTLQVFHKNKNFKFKINSIHRYSEFHNKLSNIKEQEYLQIFIELIDSKQHGLNLANIIKQGAILSSNTPSSPKQSFSAELSLFPDALQYLHIGMPCTLYCLTNDKVQCQLRKQIILNRKMKTAKLYLELDKPIYIEEFDLFPKLSRFLLTIQKEKSEIILASGIYKRFDI